MEVFRKEMKIKNPMDGTNIYISIYLYLYLSTYKYIYVAKCFTMSHRKSDEVNWIL